MLINYNFIEVNKCYLIEKKHITTVSLNSYESFTLINYWYMQASLIVTRTRNENGKGVNIFHYIGHINLILRI